MAAKKILFVSQEIAPYLPANEISSFGKALPQSLQGKRFEVRTFMPKFGNVNERRNQLHEVIRLSGLNIEINDNDHPLILKVASMQPVRIQVYFIDNDDYFQHHAVKDIEIRQTPEDNDERIMFYVRGVIETVKKLRWEPAVIQNVGWITALAPLYLKKIYESDPSFRSSKIVYSLVDDKFEGTLDPRFLDKLLMDGFSKEDLKEIADGPVDYLALNRLAMRYADGIAQLMPDVDPQLVEYAESLGIPFLPYQEEENLAQNYLDFYNNL